MFGDDHTPITVPFPSKNPPDSYTLPFRTTRKLAPALCRETDNKLVNTWLQSQKARDKLL